MEVLEESLQSERANQRETAEHHARQLRVKEEDVEALRRTIAQLPTMADHQKLRRQLRVLQAVEYNMRDSDALDGDEVRCPWMG